MTVDYNDAHIVKAEAIKLKILSSRNGRVDFTKRFDHHFKRIIKRLYADPSTDYIAIYEGLRAVVLNYIQNTNINEELLDNICMMVYTLSMMIADPNWDSSKAHTRAEYWGLDNDDE